MASLIPDFSGVSINTAGAMKNYLDASNAVATSINKPLDRITALVESNELARRNKLAEERQAAQDARQVIADQQNKQIFDLKIEDANRAKQDLIDKDAYLKGIVNPSAYGLKAGTEGVVTALGSYGDDARTQAAIAAGPGTPEYEALFKRNEDIGDYITGNSLDDRTIGFAATNPNNRYAAEEAIKASIARQSTLDKEAKDIADNQLKYQLESLKQLGKGSTGVSEDGTGTSKVGMTAGGYKVSSPDEVAETATKLLKSTYGLKPEDPLHQKVAGLVAGMANMNYSASQITEAANKVFTPGKSIDYWPDKAPEFKDIAVNVGAPKNVAVPTATNTAYTDTLSGLSQSYADRLAKIQEQRDGTYGMDKIRELINGPAQGSASVSKSNDGKTLTERINNPGAVKQADKVDKSVMWKGQTGYDDQGHAVFDTVENGFRAQAINLNTQISKQPTIEELIKGSPEKGIGAYATGNQNEYVKFISDKLGVDKNYALKPDDIPRLLKAQSQFEGSAFNETAANTGYQMAVEEGKIKVTPKAEVKDLFAKVEEKKVEEKTPDEVLKTEINTALEEVNSKLQKQFDEGKMSPFNNTLRKLGLHADQKAVETKAIGDSIKVVVEKATDTIQSADNIDSDKLRQDPNVLNGYEKAKREKYQAVGYTGMGTPFEYTVDDYIKEVATGKKFDYKDIEKRTKAEEARVNEIKSNPEVVREYRKILNEMARREGYIGTSAMPNYSIEQFIKDMKIQ